MHLRHVRRLIAAVLAVSLLALGSRSPAQAEGVAEFYRANPVNLLIGFPVANAYDTYGRAVARHLGKHIPGSPTVIPVNRPGAGSLTAANFLYSGAPKDGSTNRPLQPQRAAGAADGKFPGALRRPEIQLARECRQ